MKNPTSAFKQKWFLYVIILTVIAIFVFDAFSRTSEKVKGINVTELYQAIENGTVKSLRINPASREVTGEFQDGLKFKSSVADVSELEKAAIAKNVPVSIASPPSQWLDVLCTILPIAIMIGFILFLFRRPLGGGAGNNGNNFLGLGRNRKVEIPKEKFSDVAGCDEVVDEAKKIIDFFIDPGKYAKVGARAPKGILLVGPPGTGKTLLCRAIAGEAGVSFFVKPGSAFVELFVGQGAREVRKLFDEAKRNIPCIVFIDEIDAVGRARGSTSLSHDEREQTLNQLLTEVDGFEGGQGIIVVGATNRPEILDPALLRRFDQRLEMPLPDVKGREEILRVHAKKVILALDADLSEVARATPLCSGDKLEKIINEAAMIAAVNNHGVITKKDLHDAADKILYGIEKKNRVRIEEELLAAAYHEAGHTVVAKYVGGADPVRKVTIIPRGESGGATFMLPPHDRHILTKDYLLAQLAVCMGGSAAEKIILNQESSGPCSDFMNATKIAGMMVCELGMSEKIGKVVLARRSEFLGAVESFDCSPATKRLVEEEIKRLTDEAHDKALEIIKIRQQQLRALAKALLDRKTLTGEEVDEIISNTPN